MARPQRVTVVSLVIDAVHRLEPCSVHAIGSAVAVDRSQLYAITSRLCREGRLEVRGHQPRPDGIGQLALYGIGTPGNAVRTRPRDDGVPSSSDLSTAEQFWSRALLGAGTAAYRRATTTELHQLREIRAHGTTIESE